MKPLGRISIQMPSAKHHPKLNGENIAGWWEEGHTRSNTSMRMESKIQLKQIVNTEGM